MPTVHVRYSGPFFDAARRNIVIRKMCERINTVLTNLAYNRVHEILRKDLKHPTGFYQSNITRETKDSRGRVHDNNVIYGPWLEGVSSRNRETRFKGYHAFRRANQSVERRAAKLSEPIVAKALKELGG